MLCTKFDYKSPLLFHFEPPCGIFFKKLYTFFHRSQKTELSGFTDFTNIFTVVDKWLPARCFLYFSLHVWKLFKLLSLIIFHQNREVFVLYFSALFFLVFWNFSLVMLITDHTFSDNIENNDFAINTDRNTSASNSDETWTEAGKKISTKKCMQWNVKKRKIRWKNCERVGGSAWV